MEKFYHKSKYSSRDSTSELLLFCNIGYCRTEQNQANKALHNRIIGMMFRIGTSTCAAASLNSIKVSDFGA